MFADRFKDFPADYWNSPKHEQEFLPLFEDGLTSRELLRPE